MFGCSWAVKKLHPYLDGSKFDLITDHSALQWLFNFKGTNRRLLNWCVELQNYKEYMTIIHRPGTKHTNVDALSRAPVNYTTLTYTLILKKYRKLFRII